MKSIPSVIRLTAAESRRLLAALEKPPAPPNKRSQKALERYRKLVESDAKSGR
jgi:uncharacterized protein (DUF1778 family)